jgi:hypothetical protein
MNELDKNHSPLVVITADELREIIIGAMQSTEKLPSGKDRLLTAQQVAEILNVTPEWVYRHSKSLPFRCWVGRFLRFSSVGLQRFIKAGKLSMKG